MTKPEAPAPKSAAIAAAAFLEAFDPSSEEFRRGDAVGYELGKTYLQVAPRDPQVRKLVRHIRRDGKLLAARLGFNADDRAALLAALFCCASAEEDE